MEIVNETSYWHHFLGEFMGTAILIMLGNGVVANVVLSKTKGHNSGWIVIALGWAMAVFIAVFIASWYSFAHINPAVSLGMAVAGKMSWVLVPVYIIGQLTGAFAGAVMVWITYRQHFDATGDADSKLAVFATSPAIRSNTNNMVTEIAGTFVLVFAVFHILPPASTLGGLDALTAALLVLGIGLSLGGPTGYAINPARDLGPRIAHAWLPIPGKRDSDWGYAWIPVTGPAIGAILAALLFIRL
ncbi:MAG: MIP/aquaporin family protein [Chitinophagaceae bacterium]